MNRSLILLSLAASLALVSSLQIQLSSNVISHFLNGEKDFFNGLVATHLGDSGVTMNFKDLSV